MFLLDSDVGLEVRSFQLRLAGESYGFDTVFFTFRDVIYDGTELVIALQVGGDFDVKVPLPLVVVDKSLLSFECRLLINTNSLVFRQQRFFGPWPKMRALYQHVGLDSRICIEVNI